MREIVDEYMLKDGRRIYLLGEGRLINLAAAEGHPAMVMDMSFANQAQSALYLAGHSRELENRVYPVPVEIDEKIAALKLEVHGFGRRQADAGPEKVLGRLERGDLTDRGGLRGAGASCPR